MLPSISQRLRSWQQRVRHSLKANLYIAVFISPFSHRVNLSRRCLQTWTLAGVQLLTKPSRSAWKFATSARGTGLGSGLIMPTEKEAFAIAREWAAMIATSGLRIHYWNVAQLDSRRWATMFVSFITLPEVTVGLLKTVHLPLFGPRSFR